MASHPQAVSQPNLDPRGNNHTSDLALAGYVDDAALECEVRRAERLAEVRRAERREPVPRSAAIPSGLSNPLAHRARSCLLYLAECPGASNGAVGEGIGVALQGQVSALLARLESEGLLAKRAGGAGRPNAWRLTAEGERVVGALASLHSSRAAQRAR